MKRFVFSAGFIGGLLWSATAFAVPVFTIDGIGIGNNDNLISTTIWQNSVTIKGQTLSGIGRVNTIDAPSCGGLCWITGANGRELTFTFSYHVEKIGFVGAGLADALFSGGTINFYSDSSPDLNATDAGLTQAHALDGNLWLSLVGGPTGDACDATCDTGAGAIVTLRSTLFTTGGLGSIYSGTGHGFLNVAGGPAATHFDTNSYMFGNDIDLSSSSSNNQGIARSRFRLTGTAALQAFKVPEPGSAFLYGTALALFAGAAFAKRRKSAPSRGASR